MSGSFEPQGSVETVETMGRGNAKVHCNGVPLLWGTLGLSGGSFPCRPKSAKSYQFGKSTSGGLSQIGKSTSGGLFSFWVRFPSRTFFVVFCFSL